MARMARMEDLTVHIVSGSHLDDIDGRLDRIDRHLAAIRRALNIEHHDQETLMTIVEDIKAAVAEEHDAVVSVGTVVDQLVEEVRANIGDPVALAEILDNVTADKDSLVETALRGTAADPTTPAEPETPAEPPAAEG